jgi:hypothetical protein
MRLFLFDNDNERDSRYLDYLIFKEYSNSILSIHYSLRQLVKRPAGREAHRGNFQHVGQRGKNPTTISSGGIRQQS